jgi:DNA primase large subunit
MDSNELRTLAKYPFLRKSKEYVGSLKLSFDDILAHPIYSVALEYGRERVVDCIENKPKPPTGDRRPELVVLSYPIARMLAHCVGRATAMKYAEGEASAAYPLIRDDEVPMLAEDLGVKVTEGMLPLTQYVRLAAQLARQNPKWKLANHTVDKGYVEVEPGEVKTLLREAIKNRVMESLNLKKLPDSIKKEAANLKVRLAGEKTQMAVESLEDEAVPPCMRAMMSALAAGIASHNSMFNLATFLANLGLKKDDILKVFSRSPKYDEEKTLYQLEFLMGEKGGTEYTCPTCSTIKSHGLCKAECEVKHPLQYYRYHAKNKPRVINKEKK